MEGSNSAGVLQADVNEVAFRIQRLMRTHAFVHALIGSININLRTQEIGRYFEYAANHVPEIISDIAAAKDCGVLGETGH